MAETFIAILSITILFFVLLLFKGLLSERLKEKFCVVCTSVSLTWIVLLILYWLDIFNNQIVLALLIGGSTVGIFYLVDGVVDEKFKIFRLPFLLSIIVIGYLLIIIPSDIIKIIVLLLALWLMFIIIFVHRNNRKMNSFVKKLLECCKKW